MPLDRSKLIGFTVVAANYDKFEYDGALAPLLLVGPVLKARNHAEIVMAGESLKYPTGGPYRIVEVHEDQNSAPAGEHDWKMSNDMATSGEKLVDFIDSLPGASSEISQLAATLRAAIERYNAVPF